jgi:hypothetical protein
VKPGLLVVAVIVLGACSRTDADRPVPASEAPTNTTATPAVLPAPSTSTATTGDAGPVDWKNPAPCEEGAVKRTVYEPYVGLNSFIAASKDVQAHCTDGETHGTGRVSVVLGAKCGDVRSLRFSEGPFSAGTKSGQCVLEAFKKIKVHPFTGEDLEIAKTFVVP